MLSADHVYRLDYGEVLARHRDRRAGVTVVTSEVPADEASRQAVVEVGGDGRIVGFHYKPEDPPTTRVATEVFTFRPDRLLDTLDELAAGDGELKDFGHGLLPRLVDAGEAVEHRMAGYCVVVEPGARVRDAVLLDGCVVAADARVEHAVLDRGARVGPGAVVGGQGGDGPALVAEQAQVPEGATVKPGGRFS